MPARFSFSAMKRPATPAPATTTRNPRSAITPRNPAGPSASPKLKPLAETSTTHVARTYKGLAGFQRVIRWPPVCTPRREASAGGCKMQDERRGEKMRLGAFFHPTGNHVAAWMHPEAQIDAGTNFQHYARIAQTAERGKFDLMFVADAVAVRDGKLAALSRWPQYMAYFDPLTLLPALAAVTTHIGVVATATTSYNEPYHIARKFASLDHISGGRAGWNVVTSSNIAEAYNFGREQHYEHGERYDRAIEFVEVVQGLWDSWDDDAMVRDRASARYFDPAKLHTLNHQGTHFSVRGPLNVARPPQGHPVLFQAGSSEVGREVAARFAEGVFTPQHTLPAPRNFTAT